MRTAGIIAEYNPFHNGHAYQLRKVKNEFGADYVVVVMSGDFVQRGAPALLEKHLRAEMALRCGADLVLELPVRASSSSAEAFAMGGVSVLDGIGVTDILCFGAEDDDPELFSRAADLLVSEPDTYTSGLRRFLKEGLSFPAARCRALAPLLADSSCFPFSGGQSAAPHSEKEGTVPNDEALFPGSLPEIRKHGYTSAEAEAFLSRPNNILGLEYVKALKRLGSSISPVPLKRKGAGYHQEQTAAGEFPSATAVRKLILSQDGGLGRESTYWELSAPEVTADALSSMVSVEEQHADRFAAIPHDALSSMVPLEAFPILKACMEEGRLVSEADLDLLLRYRLMFETPENLETYQDVSPDLARKIYRMRGRCEGFSSFAALLHSKELTRARVRRALLHILLEIPSEPAVLPYARILGFRASARPLLREIKEKSRIPLLAKAADASSVLDPASLDVFRESVRASNIYEGILSQKTKKTFRHEYEKPLVIL